MSAVRVVIADDSKAMVALMKALLAAEGGIEVVGEAADGDSAVALAERLRPDVILMDFQMPGLDGIAATRAIMERAATRVIVVTATQDARQVGLALEAAAVGAVELVGKPQGGDPLPWGKRLARLVKLMAEVPVVARRRPTSSLPPAAAGERPLRAVGLVGSTGGPQALAEILAALPAGFPSAVLVVQHLPSGFAAGFARWLQSVCALEVAVAGAGEPCVPGRVYVAPDEKDLEVSSDHRLLTPAARSLFFSSGDALLGSLAATFGAGAAGVVLSGMGTDGAEGLLRLKRAGGLALAQAPETCVVSAMPLACASSDPSYLRADAIGPALLRRLARPSSPNPEP